MALGASRARGAFLTREAQPHPGRTSRAGKPTRSSRFQQQDLAMLPFIRRAPPMFHRNQGRPPFVVQPDTEHAKGESPCWLREDWLHWDSLAQWPLEHQRRVWLKVCTEDRVASGSI